MQRNNRRREEAVRQHKKKILLETGEFMKQIIFFVTFFCNILPLQSFNTFLFLFPHYGKV